MDGWTDGYKALSWQFAVVDVVPSELLYNNIMLNVGAAERSA